MINYTLRRIILKIFSLFPYKQLKAANEAIDVVIPIIKKDLNILPLCLEGVHHCVSNEIKNIYIVAPKEPEILEFCRQENIVFVEESSVLGLTPKQINLVIRESDGSLINRSGWLFQQLLKLSGRIGTCENYLCIDSDHVLVRPHTFIAADSKPVFYMSSELHRPYYDNIQILTGWKNLNALSFVAHKMVFNKQQIADLHRLLERKSGKDWITTIIESYDRTQGAGFSEFELYGNFVKEKYLRPWKQLALSYSKKKSYEELVRSYSPKYNSVTFPAFLN